MDSFWKTLLFSAAAAGVAFAGWRLARASGRRDMPALPEGHEPYANGDLQSEGDGTVEALTEEQRGKLLEELENQLGA